MENKKCRVVDNKNKIIRVTDLKNKSNVWTLKLDDLGISEKAEILENLVFGEYEMVVVE